MDIISKAIWMTYQVNLMAMSKVNGRAIMYQSPQISEKRNEIDKIKLKLEEIAGDD